MLIIDYNTRPILKVKAIKTKKPKMTPHKGRTWQLWAQIDFEYMDKDSVGIYENVWIWFDNTWGRWQYFELDDQWYKVDYLALDFSEYEKKGLVADFTSERVRHGR